MRIALGVHYLGNNFYGWQSQQNLPTIQGHIEAALAKIANEPIQVFCAGRTDAGVHATGQVIHFETTAIRNLRAWTMGTNTHLPPSISIHWAHEVDDTFHARFSALSRRYRYIIYNHSIRSAITAFRSTWHFTPLNMELMQQGANHLLGELDFSSFRSAQCESTTPMRNIQEISVFRCENFIVIEIQANAFLHHMVRNIVGVLLEVGAGQRQPDWVREILEAKDRRQAAETAPASGLYLIKVQYPSSYSLPEPQNSVLFL
jgi:tRNA pseudouridine38-40 synthase